MQNYSFELDLYGIKSLEQLTVPYMITIRPSREYVKGFKRALKPHEMNIILDLTGDEIRLCKTGDIIDIPMTYERRYADFKYYYDNFLSGFRLSIYERLIKNKFLSRFTKSL